MTLVLEKSPRIFYPFFKRIFDILFSFSFIILFSPFYLLLAILIKWDSNGPFFYVGKRLGKGGKTIHVLKFRTMYVDAEKRLEGLLKSDPKVKEEWEVFQKLQNDPRCTPVGKFLRKTSLDEFPQFFNVLLGSLSVVGPRPHFAFEMSENVNSPLKEHAHLVLAVKPGITGLWQVSGRNQLSYKERVELDSLYVEKQAFFYDLLVIFKTIPIVLLSKGAC